MKSMFKIMIICLKILAVLIVFGSLPHVALAKDALATNIRISEKANMTRLEVDLSKAVGFTVDVLADPYRVVIDVAGVNFDLPPGVGQKGQGLVKSFRYGVLEEGKSRIVLDTIGPVLIESSAARPGKGKKPALIIVNFAATTPEAFATTFAKDHPGAAPVVAAAAPPSAENTDLKVIVIDPGHGGIDSGALSPAKTLEKTVVLNYGMALRKALDRKSVV